MLQLFSFYIFSEHLCIYSDAAVAAAVTAVAMTVAMTVSLTAAANLVIRNCRQLPCDQVFHNRSYFRTHGIVIHIDAYLSKPHERAHADTAYD
jgi:hypothetical protein